MAISRADFPLPDVEDALVAPFFAAAARDELVVPRCAHDERFVWYPADACPHCGGPLTWTRVSGRGSLFSWAVVRRPFLPAFADAVPFVTALVALAEDERVRLATYIVDIDIGARGDGLDRLAAGAQVAVVFRPLSFPTVPDRSVVVPMFRLARRDARSGS
jgi:uncharacterized OB-fold protein